jgi:hypothetical protein
VSWNEAQATRDNRLTSTPWNVSYVGLNDIDAKSTLESTTLFQTGQTGTWKAWNSTNFTKKWVDGTLATMLLAFLLSSAIFALRLIYKFFIMWKIKQSI